MTDPILLKQATPHSQIQSTANPLPSRQVQAGDKIAGSGTFLPQQEDKEISESQSLQETVTRINDHVQNLHRDLHFSIDEESGRTVIKVIDSETDELIRQIPSEKLLAISRAFEEFSGLLLEAEA